MHSLVDRLLWSIKTTCHDLGQYAADTHKCILLVDTMMDTLDPLLNEEMDNMMNDPVVMEQQAAMAPRPPADAVVSPTSPVDSEFHMPSTLSKCDFKGKKDADEPHDNTKTM